MCEAAVSEIKIGLMPYSDNSGFEIELRFTIDKLHIYQGDDIVSIKEADWPMLRDAIERVFAARAALSNGVRGVGS